jgi:hypothetical protein
MLSDPEHLSPDLPSCFSIIRRHLARAFWNHTWNKTAGQKLVKRKKVNKLVAEQEATKIL